MSDWISREDVLKALSGLSNNTDRDYCNRAIRALPAVQPDAREAALREAEKALRKWQAGLTLCGYKEAPITVGMAADLVLDLIDRPAVQPDLTDPVVVHANMLRGAIAKPTLDQIIHLYGVDALCRALVPVISREAALDEMARLGQEFDAALKGESHD